MQRGALTSHNLHFLERTTTVLALGLVTACSSAKNPSLAQTGPSVTALDAGSPGIQTTADGWVFRTAPFTVSATKEKFLCYAVTAPEKMTIAGFSSDAHRVVHHFLFSQTTSKEPEGASECDVLFKSSWLPMYVATTTSANLDLPPGSAKVIAPGTQLLLQLHLLNTSADDATDVAEIRMKRSDLADPEPVGLYAFGTTAVAVPMHARTDIDSFCTVSSDVRLFAMLPHMHYLGVRMELDEGPDDDHLTPVFTRDPYSFDDQRLDPFAHTIKAGTHTRLRCSYDNKSDKTATFGESSFDEMCFGVGFAVGGASSLDGCVTGKAPTDAGVPHAPDAGVCGETVGPTGVGKPCTKTGNECPAGMLCSAGQQGGDAGSDQGICIQLGCSTSADCGDSRMTCCAPPEGGGLVSICLPEACRPLDCIPK